MLKTILCSFIQFNSITKIHDEFINGIYLNNVFILIGGIACGKSAVSTYLRDSLRLSIIDCDVLARRVVEVNKPAYL